MRIISVIHTMLFHPRPPCGLGLNWKSAWKEWLYSWHYLAKRKKTIWRQEFARLQTNVEKDIQNLGALGTLVTHWHGDSLGHLQEHKTKKQWKTLKNDLCDDIPTFLYWLSLAFLVENVLMVHIDNIDIDNYWFCWLNFKQADHFYNWMWRCVAEKLFW